MEHYYALIMAGGGGTRLWPMSRSETPKQMLPLIEEASMFQVSVQRLAPLFSPDRIYVVAGEKYVERLREQTPEIPAENFIAEPDARDSGPAAALGVAIIQQRDPDATIALLTADHHITDKDGFRNALHACHDVAQRGYIVTLGISPSLPSTAFGYIQRGEKLGTERGLNVFEAARFKEKPDLETAVSYVRSGTYSWNSGMFVWRADRAMSEFERQQPDIYQAMRQLQPTVGTPLYTSTLHSVWEKIPKKSLDYAVMEGASMIAILPVDIGWSDVGSWDALFDVLELDEDGNGFKGASPNRLMLKTKNSLVYSDKLTVTIGVENLVIVDTADVLLVCHRDNAQDVKEVVNMLKDQQSHDYL